MKTKHVFTIVLLFAALAVNAQLVQWDKSDRTNDFYDNAESVLLKGAPKISVGGEIAKNLVLSIEDFDTHSIIYRETDYDNSEVSFHGAYRFDGVSLFDLLNNAILDKKNADQFNPIIDLYVEIENDKGDKVVVSWGEIFYPIHRHEIIIATQVMRIVPSKTKELWPLPAERKLIVSTDLVSCRNISNPTKITVKSLNCKYKVDREIKMWSPEMKILDHEKELICLKKLPGKIPTESFSQVFYGRGRGIHGITDFKGQNLKELLEPFFEPTKELFQNGMFVIAAVDGYRAAFTYSEIMNRNDNSEVLIMDDFEYEGRGKFSAIPGGDFFSDRAVMAITEIKLMK